MSETCGYCGGDWATCGCWDKITGGGDDGE
jgi:hypothetical protein